MKRVDVIVVGAGAAGMMCAIEAGRRGRSVLVVDHARTAGEKIRISGGGRCNFTNMHTAPDRYLSANPGFAISALGRFTPADFVARVEQHGIAYHEKTRGQLFCDGSANQIVALLLKEMADAGVSLSLSTTVASVERNPTGFTVATSGGSFACESLVVASGGKSVPKMGATRFGYDLAAQFGVPVTETRPALVPLTFEVELLRKTSTLAGVSVDGVVSCGKEKFDEAVLFTHRGLSGPAILQISSYWREGNELSVDLAPHANVLETLRRARRENGRQSLATVLATVLPRRLAQFMADAGKADVPIAEMSDGRLQAAAASVQAWTVKPVGSEGYRTAEVTLGGVDTRALDSRTMAVKAMPGFFFIGEVVDVTGWLGGYNFQWAWASGWSAGQVA